MRVGLTFMALGGLARRMCLLCILATLLAVAAAPPASAAAGTSARAASPASAAAASIDDGLVGYWPFDEGSGSTGADQSGSGNAATLHGAASFTATAPALEQGNSSALKTTLGPNSYASAPGNNIDNLRHFTIALWMRLDPGTQQTEKHLVTLGNNKARIRYILNDRGGTLYFDVTNTTFQQVVMYPSINLTPGAHYHIVFSFDGSNLRQYLNGASIGIFNDNGSLVTGNGILFSDPTYPLDGALDDVRIYNRALTDTEIARLAFNCGGVGEIPQAECHALADIYLNTNGASWTNHTGWLQTNTPCSWYGVLCNNGHVFLLGLPNNNLSGTLPLSLNDLTGLTSLGLDGNHLSGPIPPLLSGLANLQALNLSGNQLSGELPAQIGSLASLQTLNLANNALSGDISPLVTHLTHLTALNISYNALNPTNGSVVVFLNTYQPDWAATQTVPPTNIQAYTTSSTSVAFTWKPIAYTADGGYYEVFASPGTGQYTSVGKTADKTATGITITGMQSGITSSFLVRTFTPKHSGQQNDITSATSDAIAAMDMLNRPPVAVDDSYTTAQDTPLTVDAAHGVLANDSDPDGDALKIGSIASVPSSGRFVLNLDGSFTYTPAPGFSGVDTFTYQAGDGTSNSNTATITFTVSSKAVYLPTIMVSGGSGTDTAKDFDAAQGDTRVVVERP